MKTAEKLDLGKLFKEEYATPKKPTLLKARPATYLAISGHGAPGGECFTACIGALYAMAFTIKMTRKFGGKQDYTVSKLEALWFFEGEPPKSKDEWKWKLMIRTPDFVTEKERAEAVAKLLEKGKPREVAQVKLEQLKEGTCVQMLHVGPYEREGETVAIMREFAEAKKLRLCGAHHEIYISDPRRVAPEKLKTIIRLPTTEAG